MLIIPAIDLYQSNAVRFTRGNKASCKIYSRQPAATAKAWQDKGAKWLHLVDLSAALGEGTNKDIIDEILKELSIPVEVGGGIRSLSRIEELLSAGASRLVLGTKAVDGQFLAKALDIAGREKIAVAVDQKKGRLAVGGWQDETDLPVGQYLNYLQGKKVKWVVYTDISRDGTLAGLDTDKAAAFFSRGSLNLIVSGGVSSLDDIQKVKKMEPKPKGVIVGKALYEKKFGLAEAINQGRA